MNKLELEELAKAIATPPTKAEVAEIYRAIDDCPWMDGKLSPVAWLASNWQRFYIAPGEIKPVRKYDPKQELGNGWGVYFLFDSNDRLVYIGQSVFFETRLLEHYFSSQFPWVSYSLIPVPGMFLNAVEAYYINWHRPPNNCKIPYHDFDFAPGKLLPAC